MTKEEPNKLQHEWVLWEHKAAESKNPNQWKGGCVNRLFVRSFVCSFVCFVCSFSHGASRTLPTENMSELCSFDTIEDFWKNFNYIPKPSQVFFDGECRKKVDGKTVEEYSLFKKNIEPEWGDPQNVTGGEFYCRQYFDPDVLDLYWMNLVLSVVGETMEEDDTKSLVNGVRVVDKSRGYPMVKLEIWLSDRDVAKRDLVLKKLNDIIVDGQRSPSAKMHPKFTWKDHSA